MLHEAESLGTSMYKYSLVTPSIPRENRKTKAKNIQTQRRERMVARGRLQNMRELCIQVLCGIGGEMRPREKKCRQKTHGSWQLVLELQASS